MPSLNRAELMGHLTFDPELRHIPSGMAVSELRMAVNRSWKDRAGEWKEEVLYIDVVVWGDQAERLCKILHKGSLILVEGYLKMEQWDDKNTGEKRTKIKVQADRVQHFEPKAQDEGGGNYNGGGNRQNNRQAENRSPQASRGGPPAGRGGYSGAPGQGRGPVTQAEVDDDQDVPF